MNKIFTQLLDIILTSPRHTNQLVKTMLINEKEHWGLTASSLFKELIEIERVREIFILLYSMDQNKLNQFYNGSKRWTRKIYSSEERNPWTCEVFNSNIGYIKDIIGILGSSFNKKFIDIGSGEGLPCLLLAILFPKAKFIGYEINEKKVLIANKAIKRFKLTNVKFYVQDLGDKNFTLPNADVYYMYSPCGKEVTQKILNDLNYKKNFKLLNSYSLCIFDDKKELKLPKEFELISNKTGYINIYEK